MENKHSCQEKKYIISPHQCRVGRALLKWSQSDLAKMSEMSPNSVANFEKEKTVPYPKNLRDIQKCFEESGVSFDEDDASYIFKLSK